MVAVAMFGDVDYSLDFCMLVHFLKRDLVWVFVIVECDILCLHVFSFIEFKLYINPQLSSVNYTYV